MQELEQKIERHRQFLERRNSVRPLLGAIRGWENVARYTRDPNTFFPAGPVEPSEIDFPHFLPMYQEYAATLDAADDLLRSLEPLPFFPWAEAALGCPIHYSGKNFWSAPIITAAPAAPEELMERMRLLGASLPARDFSSSRPARKPSAPAAADPLAWLDRYGGFLHALGRHFGDCIPVGQSILRGPLDLAAAAFGDENLLYQFYDRPALVREFLIIATDLFLSFIEIQQRHTPPFAGGQVIGTYYIWTPGRSLRLQEDAMALLSPDLYHEFVHPHDCAIAAAAEYSLFHLHATGLHSLSFLLQNSGIHILQVSKDEGVELRAILPQLRKIQEAGKCLLLKGRFSHADWDLVKQELDPRGLCLQAVVLDESEANEFAAAFGLPQ
jgi:hypothetical protein